MGKSVRQDVRPIVGQHVAPIKTELAHELRRRQTPAESTLWRALRTGQLAGMHFRRQQVISGLIVDFYCHKARLVVEVDGPVHDTQQEYDAERDRVLNSLGLTVLHIRNEDAEQHLPAVLRQITAHLQQFRARRD